MCIKTHNILNLAKSKYTAFEAELRNAYRIIVRKTEGEITSGYLGDCP
jgi:hypothetical protein